MTLRAEIVRSLSLEEVNEVVPASGPQPLKRISDRHRRMARMLASGLSEGEVCAACGILGPRLSVLKADPSFSALVAFYRNQVDEHFIEVTERLADLGLAAVDELQERLDTSPEAFSIDELLDVSKMALDRAGHGVKQQTNVNFTFNIAQRLEEAQRRMKTIEGKVIE